MLLNNAITTSFGGYVKKYFRKPPLRCLVNNVLIHALKNIISNVISKILKGGFMLV